jgi:phosphoglycolate phosphatase
MTSRGTIYLFDIDGTLITTGGIGRKALERAFEIRFDRSDACQSFSFGGMTDRAIFRRGLRAIGESGTDPEIDEMISLYLSRLEAEVASAEIYRVHAGMLDALERVSALTHVAVGLGTGNVEQGARIKLERVGLNPYFAFGGFGSDAESRPELIRVGAQRGARVLGLPLSDCRVVVVGDTPKDVYAAHENGYKAFGVATGGVDRAALEQAGPDDLFDTLADPGALDRLLAYAA